MKIFSNPNASLKSKYGQYQIALLGNVVGVTAEGIADGAAIGEVSVSENIRQSRFRTWCI